MVALPYTLTNGQTADAAQVMADLNAINDSVGQLGDGNIRNGAGIATSKLAARFMPFEEWVPLIPATAGTSLAAPTQFALPQALTEIYQHHVNLRTGQVGQLCAIEWFVALVTAGGGGEFPLLSLFVDGVQVGGTSVTANTAGAYYLIAYANPVDNPLIVFNDLSIFSWRVGKTGAGAATIAGVTARIMLKKELTP